MKETAANKARRRWREKHPDRVIASRRRFNEANPGYATAAWLKWRAKHPRACAIWTAKWRARNPHKAAAHVAVRTAIAAGALERGPCEVCGVPRTDGHHPDYGKPLEVRWLCRRHHKAIHKGGK